MAFTKGWIYSWDGCRRSHTVPIMIARPGSSQLVYLIVRVSVHTEIHHDPDPIRNDIAIALDEGAIQQSGCDLNCCWPCQIIGSHLARSSRPSLLRYLSCDSIRFYRFRPCVLDPLDTLLCLFFGIAEV